MTEPETTDAREARAQLLQALRELGTHVMELERRLRLVEKDYFFLRDHLFTWEKAQERLRKKT